MVMMNPFANSVRATPVQGSAQASAQGLGSIAQLLQQLKSTGPRAEAGPRIPREQLQLFTADVRQEPTQQNNQYARFANGEIDYSRRLDQATPTQRENLGSALDPSNRPQFNQDEFNTFMGGLDRGQQDMINMFAKNQAQQQMQQMMQQQMQRRPMNMGLGMANPYGMQPYQNFGRPQFPMQRPMQQPMQRPMPVPRGGYNQYNRVPMQQPNIMQQQPYQQQQYGMMGGYQQNPYQQMRPQPQQFGGYGMGQQMGGYGSYGQMPNPYQPQQMGYNPNNFSGYQQQYPAMNQFQGF